MVDKLPVGTATIANIRAGVDRDVARRAWFAGVWIWPTFTALDAYMCFVAYPGAPFSLFLLYRVIIELVLIAGYRLSNRESVAPEQLFLSLKLVYVTVSVTIALMAIHLGGIRSSYMHGISIVALVWAALIPSPWRKALPTFAGIDLAFPAVMSIGAAISPAARSTWFVKDSLVVFASNYVFVLATAILSAILSQMVWSAQQEARSLGSYQLEELIGKGGMGEVWRAKHRLLVRHGIARRTERPVRGRLHRVLVPHRPGGVRREQRHGDHGATRAGKSDSTLATPPPGNPSSFGEPCDDLSREGPSEPAAGGRRTGRCARTQPRSRDMDARTGPRLVEPAFSVKS